MTFRATLLFAAILAGIAASTGCRPNVDDVVGTDSGGEDDSSMINSDHNDQREFALYLVAENSTTADTVSFQSDDGSTMILESAPLLTAIHVRSASPSVDIRGRPAVLIELTRAGEAIMRDNVDRYLHKRVAWIWNGRVLGAPVVQSELSSRLIVTGDEQGFEPDTIEELIARLNGVAHQ